MNDTEAGETAKGDGDGSSEAMPPEQPIVSAALARMQALLVEMHTAQQELRAEVDALRREVGALHSDTGGPRPTKAPHAARRTRSPMHDGTTTPSADSARRALYAAVHRLERHRPWWWLPTWRRGPGNREG